MKKAATLHPPQSVSVVIPVFNEESTIISVLSSVLAADTSGMTLEVVIVDDGSTDSTAAELQKWHRSHSRAPVKILSQKINQGKGAALKVAFEHTSGDIVIVQDADLEYTPEEYPLLLEPFSKNQADAVYGSRFISSRPHRVLYYWHYLANLCLTTLSNTLTNLNLTDMETGAKASRGSLIRELAPKLRSKRFGFEPEITALLAKVPGMSLYEVGVTYRGRRYEEGKKITWKDGVRAVFEIVRFNVF